jgi:hypothetical protein
LLICNARVANADAFNFDDIEFWVGSGINRAAVAIDWIENDVKLPALVWGFRWDGAAHGDDMLLAVLVADDRLFAKLGGTLANPVSVYGLGYDTDDDGVFGVDDGTQFNAQGIAITSESDLGTATDPGDDYAEGWFTGFWHYGIAASNPYDGGMWTDTPLGMAVQPLADGAWNSWTFSPSFNFTSFAENPRAAESPFSAGDYDRDGNVGGADYLHWKQRYGTHDAAADGNRNGVVDAADYTVWRNSLGANAIEASRSQLLHMVPEPGAALAAVVSCLVCMGRRQRNGKYGKND